ncbi:MAG: hypothetical protein IJ087_08720 [Eggerthellaceae bacterium]|nr:hypothetical protein [Eggerthellaceae bacterium]
MGERSKARFANGIVSAVLVVFFIAHGLLGSAAIVFGYSSPLAFLVWAGMALVVVHVVASIVTSREQLTDAKRPPSSRKKRHLALKWATGAGLAACVALHVFLRGAFPPKIAIVAVAVMLAVHLCVGSKSLLADLNIPRRYQMAFRVAVCAFAAVFVVAAIASF